MPDLELTPSTLQGAETAGNPPAPDANGTGPNSPFLLCETSPISWRRAVYAGPKSVPDNQKRSVTISVKVSPDEAKFIDETAESTGMDRADFLRQLLLGEAKGISDFQKMFHFTASELWAMRDILMSALVQFLLGKQLTPEILRSIVKDADDRKDERGEHRAETFLKTLHAA